MVVRYVIDKVGKAPRKRGTEAMTSPSVPLGDCRVPCLLVGRPVRLQAVAVGCRLVPRNCSTCPPSRCRVGLEATAACAMEGEYDKMQRIEKRDTRDERGESKDGDGSD